MILSGYNKFLFSIFSENREFLVLSVYVVKTGKRFISFIKIHYTKINPSSGKIMPSYVFNEKLHVIDCSDWDIVFSMGKIIFKDDEVKIEFSSNLFMVYLNYTWEQSGPTPKSELGKDITGKDIIRWNSFDFRSQVKGHFITPYSTTEFKNALGNIDLVKSGKLPAMVKGLLWSRLHHEDLDLAYSLIFNSSKKSDSKLYLLHNKNIVEFSDIDYQIHKERKSSQISVRYPDDIRLTAKNENYVVSVNIHDNFEVNDREIADTGFMDRINNNLSWRSIGNPKGLRLLAKADIIISNNLLRTEFNGITSISEYVSFVR
jgi:hypothetical protein